MMKTFARHRIVARPVRGRIQPWLGVLLLATACATPVGVKRVDPQRVHRSITANVLTTGEPSAPSAQTLHRSNLFDRFGKDAPAVLQKLHAGYLEDPQPRDLFALAELSFVHAGKGGGSPYYLAAAVYAYAFLFPGPGGAPPDPFDPQLRLAADLYNRGLTEGLISQERDSVELGARTWPISFGELAIRSDPESFLWFRHWLEDFVPVAGLEIRGLRSRYRKAGIGAPLAARLGPLQDDADAHYERWVSPMQRVGCTAFVRITDVNEAIATGRVTGVVELYIADASSAVTVNGREIPLEYEPTAAMVLSLSESKIWDIEIAGFRGKKLDIDAQTNLVMLRPHERGGIPLVMIHGTASSPGRWAELINELRSDPRLGGRYEEWMFFYNTGNPILYSAMQLRELLREAVAVLDPDSTDPGLQRMVVMGHSQGGLIARLMASDSGQRFWDNASNVPLSEMELAPETRKLLEDALFFEPVPQVRRVIFVATPHGGSFLAGRRLGSMAGRLVQLPGDVLQASQEIFENDPEDLVMLKLERMPSSIDNMKPDSPFVKTLGEIPIDERVTTHSIIAVGTRGPPFGQHDGVVSYKSAHLEGVASEKVVISGHSVQGHPDTVAEVRRILIEHIEAE